MTKFTGISMLYPGISPIQQAKASAALPGAGAWTVPIELDVRTAQVLGIYFSYTRGAAGGAFDLKVEVSPWLVNADAPAGANVWYQTTLYDPGVLAAGADTQSRIQREYLTYQATGAAIEAGVYGAIDLGGTVSRVRISARESGVVLTPGTLQLEIIVR